CNYDGYYNYW
nr:immunoglobulin heavy chain junction region [Mus musculus]